MKATALLLEDHKQIARALDILEEMATGARHGRKPNKQDLKDLLKLLEGLGDRIHQGREEGLLFPALLQDRKQTNYLKLRKLAFEHERQRSLIEGLHEAAAANDAKDFVFCATRLVQILRDHLRDEEVQLFPLANSALSRAEDERVTSDMARYDERWQREKLPGLLRRLDELEAKYFGKRHLQVRKLRKSSQVS
jgi:hemerythrin-like domain-containing protein